MSDLFVLYWLSALVYTNLLKQLFNLVWVAGVDIFFAASQLGKYLPLATCTLANICEYYITNSFSFSRDRKEISYLINSDDET